MLMNIARSSINIYAHTHTHTHTHTGIDVLLLCAGIGAHQEFGKTEDLSVFKRLMEVRVCVSKCMSASACVCV
jgi:hypothetical protein